jgi:putative hydrolase of the HAD superfamily
VTPVLERLRAQGWSHVVLSNHVPELPAIAAGIGLTPLVDRIVTSAATGFEKPHPEAFARAFEGTGRPADVWMVGDNEVADVAGAEAVGIPAILVRGHERRAACPRPARAAAAALIGAGRWLVPCP